MDVGTMAGLSLGKDQFMRLLVAQLKNQNPMDPMSNSELVTQMSQLATLEGITDLNGSFGDLLKLYSLLSGAELLGREVEYLTDSGTARRGTVQEVVRKGDSIALVVDGAQVSPSQLRRIF